MNLKDISKEELETMGYDEIAYLVLENNKKKMKLFDLFKKVCDVLGLPEKTVEDRIGDFFELLSTNKKFVLLPNGFWDLATNHLQDIIIEDDDDLTGEELEENEDNDEDIMNEEEDSEDLFYDSDLDDSDEDDDGLQDLVVIDDEENLQE